jgi:hypothetical protein
MHNPQAQVCLERIEIAFGMQQLAAGCAGVGGDETVDGLAE